MSTFISILEEKTEIPKIDRIGLQIRKDSTTFSDNATGSIPQIDAIIKTTDGKIYKATQNLNSTYTDYIGNKTTTTNAAEPMGASMYEKFVKEYEWRNQEITNYDYYPQVKVVYGNGVYLSSSIGGFEDLMAIDADWSDYNNINYSKNGKKWNVSSLDSAIKTKFTNIDDYAISDICYGNGKFIIAVIAKIPNTSLGYSVWSPVICYSTDGINWNIVSSITGISDTDNTYGIKISYGNNKFSGLTCMYNFTSKVNNLYSIYSTDGITWKSNTAKTNSDIVFINEICYGNNKFIAIAYEKADVAMQDVSPTKVQCEKYIYSTNNNLYYSTDGINWTSTVALSVFENLQRIYYINNKFYICSNMNYAYSTDGINWTKYTPKWSDGTSMDDNSFLLTQIMCKYDSNSLLGLFVDISNNIIADDYEPLTGYVVCKSSDGITWTKLYNIDLNGEEIGIGLHPTNMIYENNNITIVSNNAYDVYRYHRWVHYYWTVNKNGNNELSYSINEQPSYYIYDDITHDELDSFSKTLDTEYLDGFYEGDLDKHSTGAYRFSGWSQTGNITFTKDSPRVTEITGTWNWVDMVKYSYSWNAPSYSDLTGLVTLPSGGSAYSGDTVSVDTKYNSDSKVETFTITTITDLTNLTNSSSMVCYGNHIFIAVKSGTSITEYYYSTDPAGTWTAGTLPSKISPGSICYGNGKFIINNIAATGYYYSTDAINWTLGGLPNVNYQVINFCNDKFIALPSSTSVANALYSTDGITWTSISFTHSYTYTKVAYGNGVYIGVSKGTNNAYAYSTDGITWTEKTLSASNTHMDILYGNNKFIMSGPSTSYLYSTDGITWNTGSFEGNTPGGHLTYGNGIFMFLLATSIKVSTDGINWFKTGDPEYSEISTNNLYMTGCYGDGKFVLNPGKVNGGSYSAIAVIPLPTSYYQFSGWNPSTDFIISEDKTISGTWSKKNKLRVSYSWSNQPSGMKSKLPSDEYYHYGDNVIIDSSYNNKSGYKGYGDWTHSTTSQSSNWTNVQNVVYNNGSFRLLTNGGTVYRSKDGVTWTSDGVSNIKCICSSEKYGFVYLGSSSCHFMLSYVSKKEDTYNLSLHSFPVPPDLTNTYTKLCEGNGKFVAMSSLYAAVCSKQPSGGWTEVNHGQGISSIIDLIYGNGVFVTIGNFSSSGALYYSTDGTTWTKAISTSELLYCGCYNNDRFVVGTDGGHVYYSTDGKSWTKVSSVIPMHVVAICAYNNYFMASSYNSLSYYSTDGITWTSTAAAQGSFPSYSKIYSHSASNGEFVVIGTGSSSVVLSQEIIYYQFSGWDKSDFNITSDTSVSGSWSQVSAGGGVNFSGLNIGDTFMLGKYQVESEDPWDIEWEIVHQTDEYQIAMTKQIIDYRCFDAKENSLPSNPEDPIGSSSGSCVCSKSSISQFLNSDQASWYSAQHASDYPPSADNVYHYSNGTNYCAYDTHKGFLYYWSNADKACLKNMELSLVAEGNGAAKTWTGKVWLPTRTQMDGTSSNNIAEGVQFTKYINNNEDFTKTIHSKCLEYNEYCQVNKYSNTTSGKYWTFTSHNYINDIYTIQPTVISTYSNCFRPNGITPCICVPRTGWSEPNKEPDLNYTT